MLKQWGASSKEEGTRVYIACTALKLEQVGERPANPGTTRGGSCSVINPLSASSYSVWTWRRWGKLAVCFTTKIISVSNFRLVRLQTFTTKKKRRNYTRWKVTRNNVHSFGFIFLCLLTFFSLFIYFQFGEKLLIGFCNI